MNENHTICAISTPPGEGGIAIIRLSGPDSLNILEKIFSPFNKTHPLPSHQMVHGRMIDPDNGMVIDQALCCRMKAPRTYTREDVAEFHCHGGSTVARMVLEICLRQGAAMAEPGEFTRRAFLSGRIDLSQAEAVAELINAGSQMEARLAARQLGGAIKEQVHQLNPPLVELLAKLEAAIDFPDEDIEIIDPATEAHQLKTGVLARIEQLLDDYEEGRIYREGIKLALVGKPNVGKSSLLNALIKQDKAIVTPIPGTTRDLIEAHALISGIPVDLFDTAGLENPSSDEVEAEGQKRARRMIADADLLLLVVDGSLPLAGADYRIFDACPQEKTLTVINKIDLPAEMDRNGTQKGWFLKDALKVSALNGEGLAELRAAIFKHIQKASGTTARQGVSEVVPNLRQKQAFEAGKAIILRAVQALESGAPMEVIALEIRLALEALGEVTGETTPDDILDQIFSRFCLGK